MMTQKLWHMLMTQSDENVDITNCDPKWRKSDVAKRFYKLTERDDNKGWHKIITQSDGTKPWHKVLTSDDINWWHKVMTQTDYTEQCHKVITQTDDTNKWQ